MENILSSHYFHIVAQKAALSNRYFFQGHEVSKQNKKHLSPGVWAAV